MPDLRMVERIVSDHTALREISSEIADQSVVAFDTEFVGEDTFVPDLCLIQVNTGRSLAIIDPFAFDSLEEFWKLFVDPNRTVVTHAGREELRIIHAVVGRTPPRFFDTQTAAGLLGMGYPLGFGPLNQKLLRRTLSKGETLTDWRRRPLTREQIRYAYDDVRSLLKIHSRLAESLEQLGRVSWAEEEFRSFVEKSLRSGSEAERWRKLKGTSNLSSDRLALVREVYRWREEEAARRNRPARTILRDDLVVEIAKRSPDSVEDFDTLRGVARAMAPGILEAVQTAKSAPPEDWPQETPRDSDDHATRMAIDLLQLVLNDYCEQNQLTMPLVTTSAELRALVRSAAENGPPQGLFASGWRSEHVLPLLLEVLRGERAVRISDLTGPKPLQYGRLRSAR